MAAVGGEEKEKRNDGKRKEAVVNDIFKFSSSLCLWRIKDLSRAFTVALIPASDSRTPHTVQANSIMVPSLAEQNLIVRVGDEQLS